MFTLPVRLASDTNPWSFVFAAVGAYFIVEMDNYSVPVEYEKIQTSVDSAGGNAGSHRDNTPATASQKDDDDAKAGKQETCPNAITSIGSGEKGDGTGNEDSVHSAVVIDMTE